jgi:hypothetical protein
LNFSINIVTKHIDISLVASDSGFFGCFPLPPVKVTQITHLVGKTKENGTNLLSVKLVQHPQQAVNRQDPNLD